MTRLLRRIDVRSGLFAACVAGLLAAGAHARVVLPTQVAHFPNDAAADSMHRVRGELDSTDAQLPAGEYVDYYAIDTRRGDTLVVELSSDGFDGYLIVHFPGPLRLGNDDHEGSTELARIEHVVQEEGSWLIAVTSAEPGELGAYELRVRGAAERNTGNTALLPMSNDWSRRFTEAYDLQQPANLSPDVDVTIAQLDRAAEMLLELDRVEHAALTMDAIAMFHRDEGRFDSADAWSERSLRIAREAGAPRAEASALHGLARTAGYRGDPRRAFELHRAALALLRDHGVPRAFGRSLNAIGSLHDDVGRADSALHYYTRVLAIDSAAGDQRSVAVTLGLIAATQSRLGLNDEALHNYRRAQRVAMELDDPYLDIGTSLSLGGFLTDPDSVEHYHRRALARAQRLGWRAEEAAALKGLALLRSETGSRDSALMHMREALEIRRQLNQPGPLAVTLGEMGHLHDILGRVDSALHYYTGALQLHGSVQNRWGEASTLLAIGSVHAGFARTDSAAAYYGRGLRLARELGARATEANALNLMGGLHGEYGRPDSALAYYRAALATELELGPAANPAPALSGIGTAWKMLGRGDSALIYQHRALAMARERRSAEVAGTLNMIGLLHHDAGRIDSAMAYYREALPLARTFRDRYTEAYVLNNVAGVYRRFAPLDYTRAAAYYDSAAAAIAGLRGSTGSDANRISFAEQYIYLPHNWARAWLGREAELGARASRAGALAAIERGRAQALLDLMRGTRELVPGADLAAEAEATLRPINATGTYTLSYALAADTLLIWLTRPDGAIELHRRAVQDSAVADGVATLRATLQVDSAAVRAAGDALEEEGDDGPGVHARRGAGGYAQRLAALARIVLPDAFAEIVPAGADIVIVPDASVALLPFAALPVAGDEPLGTRYRLRYAPSLAALADLESRNRSDAATALAGADEVLVVGNPSMPEVVTAAGDRVRLSSLPGALREARAVAEGLGATLLTGDSANERAVLGRLPHARVVHLATHGYAYGTEARARESFIALAPADGEDGLLTVGEVLDRVEALDADLVVLSACQTGLGDRKAAEGTVGFQRAFLARGARSVLVSLWSVDDAVTEMLMSRFYTHWTEGATKAEALRRAQDEVRQIHPNPRYWAAFQLVGAS